MVRLVEILGVLLKREGLEVDNRVEGLCQYLAKNWRAFSGEELSRMVWALGRVERKIRQKGVLS